MFLLGTCLCWRQRRTSIAAADRTARWLALAAAVVLIVLPHPNVSYMIFAVPLFLWAALAAYDRARGWRWVPAAVLRTIQ